MRTHALAIIRRGLALFMAAMLACLFLPGTARAYERPTSATSTVLTLPSDLTATLAGGGATAVSAASPVAMNTYGYLNSDFQPDLGPTTAALELETSFSGCSITVSSCPNLGSLTLSFSRPLTDPTLHIAGLGQSILLTGFRQVNFHAVLTLATAGITLSKAAGSELAVTSTTISTVNPNVSPSCTSFGSNGSSTPAGCGSVRLNGTGITAVSFDISGSVYQVSGTPAGVLSGAARDAFGVSVTVGQDYGDAPSAYESSAARHLNSDLRLGSGITTDNDGVPNSTSSPLAGPGAIADSDDAISGGFPDGLVGATTTYTKTVALSGVSQSARLCGWIDFDRDSAFESSERDCQNIAASQTSGTFALTGTPTSAGPSYARFRLGYTASQVESPTGPADSGEVEDYSVNFLAAAPALSLSKTADRLSTDTVGQTTTYTFTATNTGNVTVNNVAIIDPKPGMSPLSCTPTQPAAMSPGAVLSCTATRATTQADCNNGGVIANTAIANGSSAAGPVSSPPAIAHVQAQQQPAITIAKSAAPTSFSSPGQTITYTLTVTNTGNVPLSNTQVTDPRLSGLSCTPAQGSTMNPGATKTCTGTYLTTQNDVNLGGVNNTASVSGAPPSAGPNATDVDNLFVPGPQRTPDLSLIKAASPTSYIGPGETITYTFTATNTGNVTLTAVSIADPKPGLSALNCAPGQPTALAPGASMTCTATRATTQGDVNAGSVTNSATVTGTPPNGPPISRFGSVIVTGPIRTPAIDLVKTAAPITVSAPGEVVTYTLVAQNTGNMTLNGVTVTDPKPGLSSLNCSPAQPATLNPGATISCTASRATTQADINAGAIDNTASAAAGSPAGTAFDTGSATVTATRTNVVSLVKTASPSTYTAVGDTISYTLTATNTGNTTLSSLVITDPLPGLSPLSCSPSQPATRDPGETVVCTATRTITQADLDTGQLSNTATVNAVAPGGHQVSATAPNQVNGAQTRSLSLAKSASPATVTAVGQLVNYTFAATNTGNTTLQNVSVIDPQPGLSPLSCGSTQPATLAPGDTLSCTASYAATQADLNAAGISNTATARGEWPGSDPSNPADDVTATDGAMTPTPDNPEIALTKVASPTSVTDAGDVVSYVFAASNTGNVTLNTVTITDPMAGLSGLVCTPAQPALLNPGTTMTCSASRAVTQADLNAGITTNTATVTGSSPLGVTVTDDDQAAVTAPADPELVLSKVPSRTFVDAPGQVVDYTLVASNTGNMSLSNVAIDDPLPGLTPLVCTPAQPVTLQPDEVLTCTASYTATQADIDGGGISNTATGTGTPPSGTDVTDTASVTVPAQADPEITLDKSAGPTAAAELNQQVSYTFVATNTGKVTLDSVVVTDPLDGLSALNCDRTAPVQLAPGDLMTCSATYSVTQADLDFGSILNTARASGEAPGGDPSDPDDDAVDIDDAVVTTTPEASLALVKTADSVEVDKVGDVVTYTLVATNTGNAILTDVQISDPLPGLSALTCDAPAPVTLAPGDELSCSATYHATQADMDAGVIDNQATVAAEASGGDTEEPADDVTADDTEQVGVAQQPGITLTNDADPSIVGAAGQTVTFWLVATNTGDVTLTGVQIDTDLSGLAPLVCDQPATLAPGEALTCHATYLATQADAEAGHITNVATVTAHPAGEDDAVTDVVEAVVTIGPAPEIELVKTVDDDSVRAGDVVKYTLTATNTGNATLTGVVIDDPLPGLSALHCESTDPAPLAPGASLSCTAKYRTTTEDGQRGEVVNTATVTVDGETASDSAGVEVEVQPAASIHLPVLLVLANTGGPKLVWLAAASLLIMGGAAISAVAQRRRR